MNPPTEHELAALLADAAAQFQDTTGATIHWRLYRLAGYATRADVAQDLWQTLARAVLNRLVKEE